MTSDTTNSPPGPGAALLAAGTRPTPVWDMATRVRARITPEIAASLSAQTGLSAQFWLNLQDANDLWDEANGGERPDSAGGK